MTGEDTAGPPGESTRVAALRVHGASGEQCEVTLEDGESLTLSTEDLLATGLRVGDPVDEQMRAVLTGAALLWSTRQTALRLLAHRARARGELAQRLRQKGIAGALIARVLDEMEERGYLDDAAFARAYVRDRLRLRPRGRRALLAELRQKGVAADVAGEALDEVFRDTGATDNAIAVELAQSWVRKQSPGLRAALTSSELSPEREKARRRYQGFMARRGIPAGAALAALEELKKGG